MSSKSDQDVYNELCDKVQIARHILVLLMTEVASPDFDSDSLVQLVCHYTGVDKKSVTELVKGKERKTFLDVLRLKNNKPETSVISYETIRNIIFEQYVLSQQIPTKTSITKAIKKIEKANKEYIPFFLNRDLNNLGFTWKRLAKSDRYIVVENTKQFSNRMKYFQQMKEYRANDRVLIHVERTQACFYYKVQNTHATELIIVASPQLGLVDICFPSKLKTLEYFLRNKLHTLPDNSVFVIEQSNPVGVDLEWTCELPTIHSQKKDMIKWLDVNNIPCDSRLHRAELFALIDKHKVNYPPNNRCCEFLKAAGHDVILRPAELTYTKYFKRVFQLLVINNVMNFPGLKASITRKVTEFPQKHWLVEDQRMAAAEQKIYDEDQKLELILDKLMEGIKNKSLSVSDFKDCEVDEFDTDFVDNVIHGTYPNALGLGQLTRINQGPSNSSKPGPSDSPKPGPSGASKPGPSGLSWLGPSGSFKPGSSGLSRPGPSGLFKAGPSGSSKPEPSQAQPGPSSRLA